MRPQPHDDEWSGEDDVDIAVQRAQFGRREGPEMARRCGTRLRRWVTTSSSRRYASDGQLIKTHWIENARMGQRIEFKTEIVPEGQG